MRKRLMSIGVIVTLLGATPYAYGQKATEQYIPLGQSPGLSQIYTSIGRIQGVDAEKRTVTVANASGTRTVTVTERTAIWIDRTALKLSSETGRFADLRAGRTIEVKYEDPDRKAFAEWIKVAPAAAE